MNSFKQPLLIIIHFILLGVILLCILGLENRALEAPLVAVSIFIELSLLSYLNK
jgi:hypothetical protein